jgi:hypothetical protein
VHHSRSSPWKMYCIHNTDADESLIVFKFHHCLMDATGLSNFLADLFNDKRFAGLEGSSRATSRKNQLMMALLGLFNCARWTLHMVG